MYPSFPKQAVFFLAVLLLSLHKLAAQDVPVSYQAIPMTAMEQRVYAAIDEVKNGRMVSSLSEADLLDLPVGIAREINGTIYVIAIDSAYRADNGGQYLSAYAALDMPGTGGERKRIAFSGKDIAFGKGGLSLSSSTRLVLASPQSFDISENVRMLLPADGRNYLEFDCSGFKSINLKGKFLFDPGMLIPDPELPDKKSVVTATLEINATDLNNLIVATSISPFQVKGLGGVTFSVTNAVVDMSDFANPPGFIFPSDYQQTYGPDIQLWRGFYLQEVNVTLPKEMKSARGRTSVQARNLLIDDMGVSGLFSAYNVLADGSADGWAFSIDRLSMQLTRNQLTGGGFAGAINVPFLGEDTLGYAADIWQEKEELQYQFLVTTRADREFKVPFSGTVRLDSACTIGLQKKDGKLSANALLHGKMTLNHSLVSIKNISFQNLGLTTRKPYLVSGQFTLTGDGQGKMANFPIQIDSISLGIFEGKFSIGIPISLNLMNQEDKSFSASTYIRLLAKATEEGEGEAKRQRWKLEKVKVEAIAINFDKGSFGIKGLLEIFDDDPVYGKGFHGSIALKVGEVLGKGIKANAYFGSKEDYRYWHVDIYAPVKIPLLPPTPMYLDGIMGGISYHMVRQGSSVAYKPDFTKINSGSVPTDAGSVQAGGSGAIGGKAGLVYLPDRTAGIGLIAGVTFVVAQEKAVNGDLMLEVAFNQGGGLKYVQFDGAAYIMAGFAGRVRGTDLNTQAPIAAAVKMLYDNDNKVFHANMTAYINAGNAITGTAGPNGMVGEAVIHVDRQNWYVYIGRPTRMLGVQVLGLASAKTYFMIGTKIEDLPLPPSEVREMFDNIDLNFMRDENAAATGRGFAFGAHLQVGFDSKNKLNPFFVSLKVGAGADVMIRNYGDASCRGRSGKLGIDGWYASGQAYVFLNGAVGLAFKSKRFDIVRLGAAALLQAKLPNPAYMRGGVAGRYSILGGLVKGRFNLMFTVGEECDMINQGNELGDLATIADLKPDNGGTAVSVFTAPQVSFTVPIDKELPMMNTADEMNVYRVRMDEFKLYQNNQELIGTLRWNESKDLVTIRTRDVLPGQTAMKVSVKVHWEKKLAGGAWEPLKNTQGQVDYETKEVAFTTDEEPDNIPDENIAYTYPVKHQYHFHKGEHKQGYVKLIQHQPKALRTSDEVATYNLVARFETKTGFRKEVPIAYDLAQTQVTFDIPTELTPETVYLFSFVRIPQTKGGDERNLARTKRELTRSNDTPVENTFVTQTGGGAPVSGGTTVAFTENDLTASVAQDIEKKFYESDFRTSRFSTFAEKWDAFRRANDVALPSNANQMVIGKAGVMPESFDRFELYGKDTLQPLVRPVAGLNTPWLKDLMYPLLYEPYQANAAAGVSLSRVPEETGGIPPLQSPVVKLHNDGRTEGFQLTDNDLKAGFAPTQPGGVTLFYFLDTFVFNDFRELRDKAVLKPNASESIQRLQNPEGFYRTKGYTTNGYINILSRQSYPVVIRYTLPGIGKVTTEREVLIRH